MRLLLFLIALFFVASAAAGAVCDIPTKYSTLPALPEASGVAAGSAPGLLWSLDDSADAAIVAVDVRGGAKRRVRVTGAQVDDWEDISAGRCGNRRCLYIADIGDNNARRDAITIYRVPEPQSTDEVTQPAEVFTATYPDGAHDAEAAFVTTAGDVYVITKSDKTSALYKFPPLQRGVRMRLQRVATVPLHVVTDAEASGDGAWVAVRTHKDVFFYRLADLTAGRETSVRVDVTPLREPQGEGVAVGDNGAVYLVGEGGGGHAPGTLAALQCRLPAR